ncbi:MAG TPA: hypothetical protein VGB08_09070 [Allosphingosinicella sp.]|jgi:hypothetical protein
MIAARLLAATAALSLAAAPVAAAPAPALDPAQEQAEGSEMRATLILPALTILLAVLIVLVLTSGGDDGPASP